MIKLHIDINKLHVNINKLHFDISIVKVVIYAGVKVMLKAKIVQILFLQILQNYAKYTFETFTVGGITIAYQIESIT
jgi:hypothetical protein